MLNLDPNSQPFARGDAFRPLEAAKYAASRVEGWPGVGTHRQYVHVVKGIGPVRVFVEEWKNPEAPDRLFIGPNAMAAARKLLNCQELPLFVRTDEDEPGECLGWFKAVRLDRNVEARNRAGQTSSESPTTHEPRTIHGILHMRHVSDGGPRSGA